MQKCKLKQLCCSLTLALLIAVAGTHEVRAAGNTFLFTNNSPCDVVLYIGAEMGGTQSSFGPFFVAANGGFYTNTIPMGWTIYKLTINGVSYNPLPAAGCIPTDQPCPEELCTNDAYDYEVN